MNSPEEQAAQAIALINIVLHREPFGLSAQLIATRDEIEVEPATKSPCEACDGVGWRQFNVGNDQSPKYEIQRCDACERYHNDQAAQEAAAREAESSTTTQRKETPTMQMARAIDETIHGNPGERRILPANTLVVIVPATNLPPDSPVKYWASPVRGHPWPAGTEAWARGRARLATSTQEAAGGLRRIAA